MIRIGNGAGFLGDQLAAPRRLVESAAVDYLTLEYLAELTLSILARLREKDPATGYAADFIDVLRDLAATWRQQPKLRIVTNAGGMNPIACAKAAAVVLGEAGMSELPIGVVTGDDLLPRIGILQQAGCAFEHLDTGQPFTESGAKPVSVNAYLGAALLVEALAGGARLVLTGRVADASLTVAPAVHEFGWSWNDWGRLAAATVAGHVIECGAQATGGFHSHWSELELADVGYPIAELSDDGAVVITKPDGTGGAVNRETVTEQLVYEIGDPAHYLTPDVDADFTGLDALETGANRVTLSGARGRPAPDRFKVSLAYRDGYTATGQLLVYGPDCIAKARECAEIVISRLRAVGLEPARSHVELLGSGEGVPGASVAPSGLREVMLRVAVSDPRRESVERFTREFAPLATSGPAGLAGYTTARGTVRPVFAYWPSLIPKELVEAQVQVRTAAEWAAIDVA